MYICTYTDEMYTENLQKIWNYNVKNQRNDFKVAVRFVKFGV